MMGRFGSLLLVVIGVGCGGPPPPADPPLTADPPAGAEGANARGEGQGELARGIAYVKNEKYADAKPHLEKAVQTDPKNPEAVYYFAVAQEKTGDRSGAEQSYKKALALDPKFTEASQNLAALYLDDPPRPDDAIAILKTALAKSPDDARLLQNLAYAYGLKKDYENASKSYEAVLAKGENGLVRFAYGSMLVDAKMPEKAAVQLKKALELTGDDVSMLATIGRGLAYASDFQDCARAFDRAIKLKSDDPELYVRRGTCRHELKDEAGAKSDYEAAVRINKDFAAAHYYLGLSLLADKNKQPAIAELQQAAKLGGDTPIGKSARERLAKIKK